MGSWARWPACRVMFSAMQRGRARDRSEGRDVQRDWRGWKRFLNIHKYVPQAWSYVRLSHTIVLILSYISFSEDRNKYQHFRGRSLSFRRFLEFVPKILLQRQDSISLLFLLHSWHLRRLGSGHITSVNYWLPLLTSAVPRQLVHCADSLYSPSQALSTWRCSLWFLPSLVSDGIVIRTMMLKHPSWVGASTNISSSLLRRWAQNHCIFRRQDRFSGVEVFAPGNEVRH